MDESASGVAGPPGEPLVWETPAALLSYNNTTTRLLACGNFFSLLGNKEKIVPNVFGR
jgi:hypothetical protein